MRVRRLQRHLDMRPVDRIGESKTRAMPVLVLKSGAAHACLCLHALRALRVVSVRS